MSDVRIPPLVAEWSHAAPDAVYRRLTGTMVMTDLVGFTALSERMDVLGPDSTEALVNRLERLFHDQLEITESYGGQLLKFGGDALLLWFDGPGHTTRAAACALALGEPLTMSDIEAGPDLDLAMTVGLHTGEFDMFLVGSEHRELLVAGHSATTTVNTEAAAAPGQIRASDIAVAHLPPGAVHGSLVIAAPAASSAAETATQVVHAAEPETFVPRALRDLAAAGDSTERRQMVIGFLHLSGLDAHIESSGPEAAAGGLQKVVGALQQHLIDHDVTFVSSDIAAGGPKIVVAAGVPVGHENDDERLLLALRGVLDEVGATVPEVGLRIGVHRGRGLLCRLGSERQQWAALMGDVVNTAARVMSHAPRDHMLATAPPLDRSRSLFELTALAPFGAKGKRAPLTAYSVGARSGDRPPVIDATTEFIGRDTELAILRSVIDAAQSGVGRALELIGESGSGKSRLMAEALRGRDDIRLVTATGGSYATATPYFVFRSLLAALVGRRDADRIRTFVRDQQSDLEPWLPLIGTLAGVHFDPTPECDGLAQSAVPAKLAQLVIDLVGQARPTLWAIDDAHLLDAASRRLLDALAGQLAELPLTIVLSGRESLLTRSDTIRLAPLSDADVRSLIEANTAAPLLPHDLAGLTTRASGNPQFALALARSLTADQAIDGLPESIESVVTTRIDQLTVSERRTVRDLSILGTDLDTDLVRAVVGDAGHDLSPATQEFVRVDAEGNLRFTQEIVRETAYNSVGLRRRRRLHQQAAEWLSSHRDPDDVLELISYHFWAAGDAGAGFEFSLRAARAAQIRFALRDAMALYQRAVDLLPEAEIGPVERAELWRDYAHCARHFDREAAAYAHSQVRELAVEAPHVAIRARVDEAVAAIDFGDLVLAEGVIAEGLHLHHDLDLDDQEPLGQLLIARGRLEDLQHHRSQAVATLHEALELALQHDLGSVAANARAYLIAVDDGHAQSHAEAALAYFESRHSLTDQASVYNNLAVHELDAGDLRQAIEHMAQATELLDRSGMVGSAATVRLNTAEALLWQGRYAEARRRLAEAHRTLAAMEHWLVDAVGALDLAATALDGQPVDQDDLRTIAGRLHAAQAAGASLMVGRMVALAAIAGRHHRLLAETVGALDGLGVTANAQLLSHLADPSSPPPDRGELNAFEHLLLDGAHLGADPSVRAACEAMGVVALPPIAALDEARAALR